MLSLECHLYSTILSCPYLDDDMLSYSDVFNQNSAREKSYPPYVFFIISEIKVYNHMGDPHSCKQQFKQTQQSKLLEFAIEFHDPSESNLTTRPLLSQLPYVYFQIQCGYVPTIN